MLPFPLPPHRPTAATTNRPTDRLSPCSTPSSRLTPPAPLGTALRSCDAPSRHHGGGVLLVRCLRVAPGIAAPGTAACQANGQLGGPPSSGMAGHPCRHCLAAERSRRQGRWNDREPCSSPPRRSEPLPTCRPRACRAGGKACLGQRGVVPQAETSAADAARRRERASPAGQAGRPRRPAASSPGEPAHCCLPSRPRGAPRHSRHPTRPTGRPARPPAPPPGPAVLPGAVQASSAAVRRPKTRPRP